MTNPFANRVSFFDPSNGAAFANPFFGSRPPTLLVGIQRDSAPPFLFGGSRLQRMRVILIAPEQALDFDEFDPPGDEDDFDPEVLPPLPVLARKVRGPWPPRLVQGEILRGENGELYERLGDRIRPLGRLASGPRGEVLDVLEAGSAPPPAPQWQTAAPTAKPGNERATRTEAALASAENQAEAAAPPADPQRELGPKSSPPCRALFAEPGQWRIVRLGDFKAMLTPQLAHPERLRDAHRLPCYVRVFELSAPQRIEALAATLLGDAARAVQLQPLSPAVVTHLQLAPALPAPRQPWPLPPHEPGRLLPGERVVHLQLASDPTAEEPTTAPAPVPTQNHVEASTTTPATGTLPAQSLGPPSAPVPPNTPSAPTLKTTIPTEFLKPWEFRLSREEALYDLSTAGTASGRFRAALRRFVSWLRLRDEFRKWQILLHGRSLDEQLWAVRPPGGGVTHPFVREWARRALELSGHDARAMLTEWEIFWRRKGV